MKIRILRVFCRFYVFEKKKIVKTVKRARFAKIRATHLLLTVEGILFFQF